MTDTNTKRIQIDWELAVDISVTTVNRKFKSVQGANIIPEYQNFEFGKRNSEGEYCEIIFEIEPHQIVFSGFKAYTGGMNSPSKRISL